MKRTELVYQARELVFRHYYGTLATRGEYPYASLVRYSVDGKGQPVLMLSRIAEHTQNLQNGFKVSLLVFDNNGNNIQESARITLMGTLEIFSAENPEHEESLQTHYAFFPETQDYFEKLDFDLYRLSIQECRYVGGFAAAYNLSGADFVQANPLEWSARKAILGHMNGDHQDAIVHYCNTLSLELNGFDPEIVWMDRFGFQVRIGQRIERIQFSKEVFDRTSAREAFVEMAGAHE
jgi:heme iron utilization protein